MTPIINPWFLYLISVLENICFVVAVGTVVLFVGLLIASIVLAAEGTLVEYKKWIIKGVIVLSLLCSFLIFIPSKSTVIQMIVLNNITYQRLDKAKEIGKDIKEIIKQDIIDILKEVGKEKK